MTPAQRQYDLDLVASMQRMAAWLEPRSRKVATTLKLAAERIEALLANVPIQPASKPDEANKPNP